jgi:hypothetical protein
MSSSSNQHILTDKSLSIVFTYAPAGLGHLRVTDALRHGLPESANPILLPSQDESIRIIHRITSIHPLAKQFMEWMQKGAPEQYFTRFYRKILRSRTKSLEQELYNILKQRVDLPDTLLIVSTHFALAHQAAVIKKRLEQRANVKIILVVQVTDDSPQRIWYVPGADVIYVPSEKTKQSLERYAKESRFALHTPIRVLPYPLSKHLGEPLSSEAYSYRKQQFDANSDMPIQVAIPISGAAVGTFFLSRYMHSLRRHSKRWIFHIIAKDTLYTMPFIQQTKNLSYAEVFSSHSDRQIVELYEQAYTQTVVSLEVTKPSEQAFKCMFSPKMRGGSILLFMEPVGRQEYDNIDFLRRHELIPSQQEQEILWEMAHENQMSTSSSLDLKLSSKRWRGICLPRDAKQAALFTQWCLKKEIFTQMLQAPIVSSQELGSNGTERFWDEVSQLIPKK